jgi:hypothetical protein
MDAGIDRLRRELGGSRAPTTIIQEAFEGEDSHLRRLSRLAPGASPEPRDLYDYTEDLRYGTGAIQADLLRWVLPWGLQAWRDDLTGRSRAYGGFVEQFYPVLANERVLGSLSADQRGAVARFMREGLIVEIDNQQGLSYSGSEARPYRWIAALAGYGVLFPDIERLSGEWWSGDTRGRAVAVVQYGSCLIYDDDDNPVFAPWTHDGGGGPPCLWGQAGDLDDEPWLEENVRFLRGLLHPASVLERLGHAASALVGHIEGAIAGEVLNGAKSRPDVLASRCAELPCILAHTQAPHNLCEWTV